MKETNEFEDLKNFIKQYTGESYWTISNFRIVQVCISGLTYSVSQHRWMILGDCYEKDGSHIYCSFPFKQMLFPIRKQALDCFFRTSVSVDTVRNGIELGDIIFVNSIPMKIKFIGYKSLIAAKDEYTIGNSLELLYSDYGKTWSYIKENEESRYSSIGVEALEASEACDKCSLDLEERKKK